MNALPRSIPILLLAALVAAPAVAEEPPDATATELLAAHNREREAESLPPLALDPTLTKAARLHAEDMAGRREMTHEGADGSKPFERVKRAGYRFVTTGENVARGQETVAQVMKSWMESEGHRKNILGGYTQMGGARVDAEDGEPYWCVVFGTPRIPLDPDVAEKEVAEEVAAAREEAGKSALEVDPKLAKAARTLAADMAAHAAKPEGERKPPDVAKRLEEAGASYRSVAVIVGGGDPTAEDFVKSTLADESRKTQLLGKFDAVGIGYAADSDAAPFWCVVLVER